MRSAAICLLLALLPPPVPGRSFASRAEYIGGTRGDIAMKLSGEIRVADDTFFIFVAKHTLVKIPYERINMLEYGQKVDRRYTLALISPLFATMQKREHFLTVGFENDNGKQEALLFRIEKEDVRVTLVALEARTGRQIEYQDAQARMAGNG